MVELKDVVVIGAGPGGFAAAVRAAQLGGDVVVVEEAQIGGNCMHRACIPLTFLTQAGAFVSGLGQAASLGFEVAGWDVDPETMHGRKDLIIEGLCTGAEEQLRDHEVTIVGGRGKLVGPRTVAVGGRRIRSRNVIIATGSVAGELPIEGAGLPGVMNTAEAIGLREIPDRLAIVGNHPWEIELAQYFHAMGSEVVLISEDDRLLPAADREISQRLAKHLHDSGIAVERGATLEAIHSADGGSLALVVAQGAREILVDRAVASPRFPNSTGLGLREVGVMTERGALLVDGRMRTNVPGIYAVGDVTVGPMWSHQASAEGIVAAEAAMGLDDASSPTVDEATIPRCLHTHPQVAWVGLTADEAADRGLEVCIGKAPLSINPDAVIRGETQGVVKIIAGAAYGKVLGVHIMGPGAIDLINVPTAAMLCEATVQELMRLTPAHPSIGEALVDAAMDVEGRSLHLPKW